MKRECISAVPARFRQTLAVTALMALMALGAPPAGAAGVLDRAAMGGTDLVNWAQIPYVGTAQGFYGSLVVLSDAGQAVDVSVPNTFWRTEQGPFQANFLPGEAMIASGYGSGSNTATLRFATPLAGVGAQFANTVYYGPFTARVEAFDAQGLLLESHTRDGETTGAANGSAIFLGVLRPQNDIARVDFSVLPYTYPGAGPGEFFTRFAINQVTLTTVSPVPEPAAAVLALLGLPLLLRAGRRAAA